MGRPETSKPATGEEERLHRFLARAGLGSRRRCEALILEGKVRVNGRTVSTLGTKIVPGVDAVTCGGRPVPRPEQFVYFAVHKPAGVVTTLADPEGRPVVRDLLPRRGLPRVFPVGRLDYHTEGLLLLTNDGALAHVLAHPRFEVEKEYRVKVRGSPTERDLARLRAGVWSDGERLRVDRVAVLKPAGGSAWLTVVVREGRYREIRRMCEAIGHPVLKLRRVRIGPILLGRLPTGAWRRLSDREVARLRRAVPGKSP
jgi:23S rRNA pseudouridine2605 synthase